MWFGGASWLEVAGCYYRHANCCEALLGDLGALHLEFRRDPDNPHDPNAVKILINGIHVGFVAREEQEIVRAAMEAGGVPVIRRVYVDRRGLPDIHYAFAVPETPKKPKRPKAIKVSCPHCGQHYELGTPRTDKAATCTVCGGQFTVAAWVAPEPPPPRPVEFPPISVPPAYFKGGSPGWLVPLVVIVCVVAAFVLYRVFAGGLK